MGAPIRLFAQNSLMGFSKEFSEHPKRLSENWTKKKKSGKLSG
jgi:hypothetical protein